jgi:hypothetical protein
MACPKNVSFKDCELSILRKAVDLAEQTQGHELLNTPEIKNIIKIVEDFISNKKLIIYGGTAINNILPKYDQFYDYGYEIPDYDFFSKNALDDSKELADIYVKKGFSNIEAKAGVHFGTFKVFVNNIGIADITQLHPDIFNVISKDAINKKRMLYAPANFLRQSMYLELSRPNGDVSRWEKILKRLILLNKHYPLIHKKCDIQRKTELPLDENKIFNIVKKCFVDEGLVFIGGYANALYSKYSKEHNLKNLPDFDVLSNDPEKTCEQVKKKLKAEGFEVRITKYDSVGELLNVHYSIQIHDEYIAFVYKPSACHSYNEFFDGKDNLKVGTIDTLLSFYLAFMYADKEYYDINRLICLSTMLFNIQQHNRLKQKGLLKRFSVNCYGVQHTLSDIRNEKSKMKETLKKGTRNYDEWFLNYVPKTRKNKNKK